MGLFGIALIVVIAIAFAGIGYHAITGTPVREALRRLAGTLICRSIGHSRRRDTVRKVGNTYLARCGLCGVKLTREGREGEWHVTTLVPMAAEGVETSTEAN
jgi:hypothetical protein